MPYGSMTDRTGAGYGEGNRQTFSYSNQYISKNQDDVDAGKHVANWGNQASRSLYSVHGNQMNDNMKLRSLEDSRLWHGVPQLTQDQMEMFEAAYQGHTFIFMVQVPKFMTTGIYHNKNLHYQMKNFKAVVEKASTGFSGASNITANFADQDDGNGKKLSHVTSVTKEQNDITLRLREFAGLPVKNCLESWITGVYDYKSQHGHYFGNLGIPGGWCLANHTAAILVVQVDPSWQVIQDAAYYYNMFPTEVPFEHFDWTKGEQTIVDDYSITFRCNEERSPMITYAAERYMNNRILSMVATSVYNSRQFVAFDFMNDGSPMEMQSYNAYKDNYEYFDREQYNIRLSQGTTSNQSAVERYAGNNEKAALEYSRFIPDGNNNIGSPVPAMHNPDSNNGSGNPTGPNNSADPRRADSTTEPWRYTPDNRPEK